MCFNIIRGIYYYNWQNILVTIATNQMLKEKKGQSSFGFTSPVGHRSELCSALLQPLFSQAG